MKILIAEQEFALYADLLRELLVRFPSPHPLSLTPQGRR